MIPILLLSLPLLFLFRKPIQNRMSEVTQYNIEKSFRELYDIFGYETTSMVERIFRIETRNFSSGGFMKTFGAGMEAVSEKFPYGWGSLKKLWSEQKNYAPKGILTMKENKQAHQPGSGKEKKFLVFPNLFSSLFAVAIVMKNRGNRGGSWYSNDEAQRKIYDGLLSGQAVTITNKVKNIKESENV